MSLAGVRIGFAVTGSHCTLEKVLTVISSLREEKAEIIPVFSSSVQDTDTRFGNALYWKEKICRRTQNEPITNIVEAEPVGPKNLFDVMVIAPCSGNTLAKLANGFADTPVLMASKAHLRNNKPLILGISTNDGLGINAKNIGLVLNMKNIFLVPFGQDRPEEKNNSLVSHMNLIPDTVKEAIRGKQLQPVLREYCS